MADKLPSRRELLRSFTPRPESSSGGPKKSDSSASGGIHSGGADATRQSAYVEHYSVSAMACQFETIFNIGQYEQAAEASLQAFELIARLEQQMTIYQDWSELSRINQRAGSEWVTVEEKLFELLMRARDLWELTEHCFDITSTPLSRVWGFNRREGRVPDPSEIEETLRHVGMQHVEFDRQKRRLRFGKETLELNLGGIGKGYAIDCLVELLEQHGIANVLVHGGQSSLVARGERTGIQAVDRRGWTVGLSHPIWPDLRLAEIQLVDAALGTSGTGRQGFYFEGKRYGHILDPRTGMPAEGMLSATVIAPTGAEADALATACYVGGLPLAKKLASRRNDLALLLCLKAERRDALQLVVHGLDEADWRFGHDLGIEAEPLLSHKS